MSGLLDERELTPEEPSTGLTPEGQAAYEAEADAYFAALDYGFERFGDLAAPAPLPTARVVRRSWWRRLLRLKAPATP